MTDDEIEDLELEIRGLESLLELKRAQLAMEKSRWKPSRPLDGERMPHATRVPANRLFVSPPIGGAPYVEGSENDRLRLTVNHIKPIVERLARLYDTPKEKWWRRMLRRIGWEG